LGPAALPVSDFDRLQLRYWIALLNAQIL
jgi:hypothetical protein